MRARANGTIVLKTVILTPDHKKTNGSTCGPISQHKQFRGDLEATSTEPVQAAVTLIKVPADFAAYEQINGTLNGRKGSFILKYKFKGAGAPGRPPSAITVVPKSGTDELKGLSGKMEINIADGKHSYVFEYTLPN